MKFVHPHFNNEIDLEDLIVTSAFRKLQDLYQKIPATKCLFCPKKKTVEADCCETFHPPFFLTEFLNAFRETKKWPKEKQYDLYITCIKTFLNPEIHKPCALLDKPLCSVYMGRPFSCRMYGQYSQKEWAGRLENVKKALGLEKEEIPMYEQCPNVEATGTPKTISKEMSDYVFDSIQKLDRKLFQDEKVAKELEKTAATYLTFDAHYILLHAGPELLETLTDIRLGLKDNRDKFKAKEIDEKELEKAENSIKEFIKIIENSIRK